MTPDPIITAEILAGLTKCPFCGAEKDAKKTEPKWANMRCGTILHAGHLASGDRSGRCRNREIRNERDTFRARVLELEEVLRSVISEVQSVDNRTVMNRDDHWMSLMAEASVACYILKKGTK